MTLTSESFKRSTISINNISKSLGSTRKSLSSVNDSVDNISKIIANNTKNKRILTEKSALLISRREEASRRREIEDESESRKVSTDTRSGLSFANKGEGGPLSRLIGFLGFTTAGWIVENLPTWTFMGKEFISRVQTFGASMYNMIDNITTSVNLFGETLKSSLSALIQLDFGRFSSEGSVTKTFEEFNKSIQDLGNELTDTFKLFTTPLTESLTTGEQAPGLGETRPDSLYENPSTQPNSPVTGVHKEALNIIAKYESITSDPSGSGYNAMNQGGEGMYNIYGSGSSDILLGKKLTDMTVAEIMERQRKNKSYSGRNKVGIFAAGRYQFIPDTLKSIVDAGIIKVTDKFDAATQDKAALYLIKKNGIRDWAWNAESLARFSPQEQRIVERARTTPIPTTSQTQSTSQRPPTEISGYTVKNNEKIITNYTQLPEHKGGTRTTYGGNRLKADFTLYKGGQFLNIPVPSPVDGTVNYAGYAGNGGNWVEIQSQRGLVELGHFNSLKVRQGDRVTIGTILGLQGYSGRVVPPGVDGTHVHIQAPDAVIQDYISLLSSGRMPSGSTEQPAQISPPARPPVSEQIKPERKGPQVVVIDDAPPPVSQTQVPYPVLQVQSSPSMINESKLLNNFIKNKLLLDLAYL